MNHRHGEVWLVLESEAGPLAGWFCATAVSAAKIARTTKRIAGFCIVANPFAA
jgi:hypothetical protein